VVNILVVTDTLTREPPRSGLVQLEIKLTDTHSEMVWTMSIRAVLEVGNQTSRLLLKVSIFLNSSLTQHRVDGGIFLRGIEFFDKMSEVHRNQS